MAFGMGFGELALVFIIVVIVFGSAKLPSLNEGLRRRDAGYDVQREERKPEWTRSEWALVLLTGALATLALTLEILRHRR
jgi:hypothetical protein